MTIANALFDDYPAAAAVVERLKDAGVPESDISIVANDKSLSKNEVVDDAADGAGIGAVLGGGAGLMTGIGIMAIPGLGPVVARRRDYEAEGWTRFDENAVASTRPVRAGETVI